MALETLAFVSPEGDTVVLTDTASGYDVLPGPQGQLMAPVGITEGVIPLANGARVRRVFVPPRDASCTVDVWAIDSPTLRDRLRDLLAVVDPNRGEGLLRRTDPRGQVRELHCRYSGGAEGDESENSFGQWHQTVVLEFRASDPFWYSASPQIVTMLLSSETPTFFPFFPLRLTGSEIFSDVTATNGGDYDAWPVWTITGPGVSPVIRNLTTGDLIDLTGVTISAGERWTIDGRPGHKTITDGAGANRFADLSIASSLFALAPGSNAIQAEMSGATADSLIVLSFLEPFRSA